MRMKRLIMAGAFGAGTLCAAAALAAEEGRSLTAEERLWSEIEGAAVAGPDGEEVATVKNLLLQEDGTIKQVILGHGGILGVGQTLVAVPPDSLTPATGGAAFTTTFSKESLKETEAFEYGTEDDSVASTETGWIAGRLIGMAVVDEAGEEMTEVEDLIIAGDKATHALLEAPAVKGDMAGAEQPSTVSPSGTGSMAGGGATTGGGVTTGGGATAPGGAPQAPEPPAPSAAYIAVPFDELTIEQGSAPEDQLLMLRGGSASLETAERVRLE